MTTRDLFSDLSAPSKPDTSQEIASLCRVLLENVDLSPCKKNDCYLFIYYHRNTSNDMV